jgi:hypothetical protein
MSAHPPVRLQGKVHAVPMAHMGPILISETVLVLYIEKYCGDFETIFFYSVCRLLGGGGGVDKLVKRTLLNSAYA